MTFWEKVLKFARIATASIAALAAIIALISIRARSGPRSGTLSHIPLAINKRTNYENFEAECPHCKEWSVFNRASDLHTFERIARRDVNCFHCHKPYRIMGDARSRSGSQRVAERQRPLSSRDRPSFAAVATAGMLPQADISTARAKQRT